jgi:hypothetical protein
MTPGQELYSTDQLPAVNLKFASGNAFCSPPRILYGTVFHK